ncbi:Alpha/Beta hydrolase protein, partial [Thamnocephalis sphaerospora]
GGEYVLLKHGETRYYLMGPEDGSKVVLVHGLSWPSPIWDEVAAGLVKQGHRVLLYDLYGRGYSECPDVVNNADLYVEQLSELLEHVGWSHCSIVGLSMGGGIVAAFTARYPEKVERLGIIAGAGLMSESHMPLIGKLAGMPLVDRLVMGIPYDTLARSFQRAVADNVAEKVLVNAWQMSHNPGALRSVARSACDFPMTGLHKEYAAVGRIPDLPVLAIWSPDDKIVPFECTIHLRQAIPHVQLSIVEDGGHDLVVSRVPQVTDALTTFLAA